MEALSKVATYRVTYLDGGEEDYPEVSGYPSRDDRGDYVLRCRNGKVCIPAKNVRSIAPVSSPADSK